MTTTKIIYAIAAIVPGGLIVLACIGILHVVSIGLRDRKLRRLAQSAKADRPDVIFQASL
jgi:hypothetical protein